MDINLSKNLNMGFSPQSKETRNSLVEIVLLIVVSVIFGWFIILPKSNEISTKKTSLAQIQQQEATMKDDLSKLQGMVQTMQSSPAQVADLDQALPLDGNTVDLQILINNLAASVGVTVQNIAVSGDPSYVAAGNKALLADPYGVTRTLKKLTGSVSVAGNFTQIQAFLGKLETSARLVDVTDLDMGPSPDGTLSLRLSIDSYYLSQ